MKKLELVKILLKKAKIQISDDFSNTVFKVGIQEKADLEPDFVF